MNWISTHPKTKGVLIRLTIQPKASRSEVVGLHGTPARLKVRIAAPPVDGAANDAVCLFLKKLLGVTQSQIEIIRGHTSKNKDILIEGIELAPTETLLLQNTKKKD